jgi:hypothetical protein
MRATPIVFAPPGRNAPDGYYLLDVWRDRPNFADLLKQVKAQKEKWKATVVIVENKASGISLIEVLNEKHIQPWLMSLGPEKGKVERARQQTVKFEQGQLGSLQRLLGWRHTRQSSFSPPTVSSMIRLTRPSDCSVPRTIRSFITDFGSCADDLFRS